MANEVLYVPEEYLLEVIAIIRAGLAERPETAAAVRDGLEAWCDQEQAYAEQLAGEDDDG